MTGMKTFKETDPNLGPGGQVSSRQHPFQSFQWSDFSAKPAHDYTYTIIPLYGTPAALIEGSSVQRQNLHRAGTGAETLRLLQSRRRSLSGIRPAIHEQIT